MRELKLAQTGVQWRAEFYILSVKVSPKIKVGAETWQIWKHFKLIQQKIDNEPGQWSFPTHVKQGLSKRIFRLYIPQILMSLVGKTIKKEESNSSTWHPYFKQMNHRYTSRRHGKKTLANYSHAPHFACSLGLYPAWEYYVIRSVDNIHTLLMVCDQKYQYSSNSFAIILQQHNDIAIALFIDTIRNKLA